MTGRPSLGLELPDDLLDRIADAVANRVVARLQEHIALEENGWLTTREAANYLGTTVNALHKSTSNRAIPFSQDGKGAKCWFRRTELDAWREINRRGQSC